MSRKTKKVQPDWLQYEQENDSIDTRYETDSNSDSEALNNSQEELSVSEYSDSEVDNESSDYYSDDYNNNNNNNNSSSSKNDCNEDGDDGETLLGKDKKTMWSTNAPNKKKKTAKHNIVLRLSNVKKIAQSTTTPLDCWKLFFPEDCVQEIVKFTNIHFEKIRPNYQDISAVRPTTVEEMHAFIGLLYLLGLYKVSHLNLREFWTSDGTSPDCIKAVMSLNRFGAIMSAVRFDNPDDREERKKIDNLAAVCDFSSGFIQRCSENYSAGAYTTIDEMLEAFRGKCKFRQYIPSKPARYGIKIYSLVDSKSFYTLNMEIYCGKQPPGPYEQPNSSFHLVKRLITPISETGRHVTFDNFFTSIPLAEDLLKTHKTTLVGTIRKNKRELPPEIVNVKKRNLCSSKFIFKDDCTVVSYVPKKNKNVILLSTLHQSDTIDEDSGSKLKPEILTFYNMTKGGVDVVDELKGSYSVARETNRWPMVIFFSFLNIAGINAQIIWSQNTKEKIERRKFIRKLSVQLIQPHLITRSKVPTLSAELKNTILKVGNIPMQAVETNSTKQVCRFCPRQKNSYSKKSCSICGLTICPKHATLMCPQCQEILTETDGD